MPLELGYCPLTTLFSSQCEVSDRFETACATIGSYISTNDRNIWFSEVVPGDANLSFPEECWQQSQVVSRDICRIAVSLSTSDISEISLEVWLPRDWSGRFLSTANGGLSGSLGFATVGTNAGHNGTTGESFLNNPDILTDWSWRGIHTATVVGKEISQTFYSRPHDYSYFLGCSTGGRQGFKSAQAFPDDFDGILAGDPGIDLSSLLAWIGNFYLITGPANSSTFVPLPLWSTIYDDMLRQCDNIDGVLDGIIENPAQCHYRPEALLCNPGTGNNDSLCLTGEQANTVRQLLSPLYLDGKLIYPAMYPSPSIDGTPELLYGGEVFSLTVEWLRYVLHNDPSWDPATMNITDLLAMIKLNAASSDSFDSDLSAFRDAGGKLLTFHGLQDGLIPSSNSERYYDYVARTMSLNTSALDEFYRYFQVSGMGHCCYGPGAWMVGQNSAGNTGLDPKQNLLMALVRWVEEGVGPDTILGTKFVNDDKLQGGSGDGADPEHWECI
ncbi:Tannase/feruloyl esterase [Penicillium expansum]|nr:Tannase/feruloyl esterase [Penicillium expansum]